MSKTSRKRKSALLPALQVRPDVVALFVVVGFMCFYVAGSIANAAQK